MSKCKRCKGEISWVRTEGKKLMPIDMDVEVIREKDGTMLIVGKPHWATCPFAEEFRNAPRLKASENRA